MALGAGEGVERAREFPPPNFTWAPSSGAEFSRWRWQIAVFCKQIKQTLRLSDLGGTSANAVRWQGWTARLVDVLLRAPAFVSRWGGRFVRLWAVVRSGLGLQLDWAAWLESSGPAGGDFRLLGQPDQAFLPGFRPVPRGEPPRPHGWKTWR